MRDSLQKLGDVNADISYSERARLHDIYAQLITDGNIAHGPREETKPLQKPFHNYIRENTESGHYVVDVPRVYYDFGFIKGDAICAALDTYNLIRYVTNPNNNELLQDPVQMGIVNEYNAHFRNLCSLVAKELDIEGLITAIDLANAPQLPFREEITV